MTAIVKAKIDTMNGALANDAAAWIDVIGDGSYWAGYFKTFDQFYLDKKINNDIRPLARQADTTQYADPCRFGPSYDNIALTIEIMRHCDARKVLCDGFPTAVAAGSAGGQQCWLWPAWQVEADGVTPELVGAAYFDDNGIAQDSAPARGLFRRSQIYGAWSGGFQYGIAIRVGAEKMNIRGIRSDGVLWTSVPTQIGSVFGSTTFTTGNATWGATGRVEIDDCVLVQNQFGGNTACSMVIHHQVSKNDGTQINLSQWVVTNSLIVLTGKYAFGTQAPYPLAPYNGDPSKLLCENVGILVDNAASMTGGVEYLTAGFYGGLLINTYVSARVGHAAAANTNGAYFFKTTVGDLMHADSKGNVSFDASSPEAANRNKLHTDLFVGGSAVDVGLMNDNGKSELIPLNPGPLVGNTTASDVGGAYTVPTTAMGKRTRKYGTGLAGGGTHATIGPIETDAPADDGTFDALIVALPDRAANRMIYPTLNFLGANAGATGNPIGRGISDGYVPPGGHLIIEQRGDVQYGALALMPNGNAVYLSGGHLSFTTNNYAMCDMATRAFELLDGGGLPTEYATGDGGNPYAPEYPDDAVLTGHHYGQEAAWDSATGRFGIATADAWSAARYAGGVGPGATSIIFYNADKTLEGWENWSGKAGSISDSAWRVHFANPDPTVSPSTTYFATANGGGTGLDLFKIDWTQALGSRITHVRAFAGQLVSAPARLKWIPAGTGGTLGRLVFDHSNGGEKRLVLDSDNPAGGWTDITANFTGSGAVAAQDTSHGSACDWSRKEVWYFHDADIVVHSCDPAGTDAFAVGASSAGTVTALAATSDDALRETALFGTTAGGSYGSAVYDPVNDGFHIAQGGYNAMFLALAQAAPAANDDTGLTGGMNDLTGGMAA